MPQGSSINTTTILREDSLDGSQGARVAILGLAACAVLASYFYLILRLKARSVGRVNALRLRNSLCLSDQMHHRGEASILLPHGGLFVTPTEAGHSSEYDLSKRSQDQTSNQVDVSDADAGQNSGDLLMSEELQGQPSIDLFAATARQLFATPEAAVSTVASERSIAGETSPDVVDPISCPQSVMSSPSPT